MKRKMLIDNWWNLIAALSGEGGLKSALAEYHPHASKHSCWQTPWFVDVIDWVLKVEFHLKLQHMGNVTCSVTCWIGHKMNIWFRCISSNQSYFEDGLCLNNRNKYLEKKIKFGIYFDNEFCKNCVRFNLIGNKSTVAKMDCDLQI